MWSVCMDQLADSDMSPVYTLPLVTDSDNNKVLKLSQDGRLLQTIDHAGSKRDHFNCPLGVSVSPEGLLYICDTGNHRFTVHDEECVLVCVCVSVGVCVCVCLCVCV